MDELSGGSWRSTRDRDAGSGVNVESLFLRHTQLDLDHLLKAPAASTQDLCPTLSQTGFTSFSQTKQELHSSIPHTPLSSLNMIIVNNKKKT